MAAAKKNTKKSSSTVSGSKKSAGKTGTGAKAKTASKRNTGSKNTQSRVTITKNTVDPLIDYSDYGREKTDRAILQEALLWLLLAVCILTFISYLGVCGYIGSVISDVSFGIFGISAYIFPILIFIAVVFLISNKGNHIAGIKTAAAVLFYLCVCGFVTLFTSGTMIITSISEMYDYSASIKGGGGVIGGTICAMLCPAIGTIGTGVVLFVLALISCIIITQKSLMRGMKHQSRKVYHSAKNNSMRRREELEQRRIRQAEWEAEHSNAIPESDKAAEEGYNSSTQKENRQEQQYRKSLTKKRGRRDRSHGSLNSQTRYAHGYPQRRELDVPVTFPAYSREDRAKRRVTGVTTDTKLQMYQENSAAEVHEIMPKLSAEPLTFDSASFVDENEKASVKKNKIQTTTYINLEDKAPKEAVTNQDNGLEIYQESMDFPIHGITIASEEKPLKNKEKIDTKKQEKQEAEEETIKKETSAPKKNPRSSQQEIEEGIASVEAEAAEAAKMVRPKYIYPPLDLLKKGKGGSNNGQEQEVRRTAAKLQQTLESFGVRATVTNVSCGPAVTRYELQPEQGVKVSRIVGLSDDIKLNLAAADIRIEAPIPGKAAVGIEVPNSENSAVALRDLFESPEFQKHPSRLAFATGKDIGGKVVVSDIAKMPHLLIAGATGSGKSVCINTLIMSILYKADPEDVKLIMIDPKVVELSVYNGIPHLFIPVVTDPKKAAGALNWGVAEMTDRYNKFAEYGVRDLKGYNKKIEALDGIEDENKPKKMPQIVIIVDELADLMMVAPGEVEDSICRLAQLARAAGIHLVIATQRPSVNVITGLIKANMPSRIAFSVTSSIDSRTILDMGGAEKLLGKGDMLFYPQGYQKPARVQGAFVSDEEVSDVVDFLKNQNFGTSYNSDIEDKIAKAQQSAGAAHGEGDVDALFADAGKFIIEKDKASIGMLQRVFKIGFNRAARIMDQLSDAGVVGPEEGTKPRKILMSPEEFENYLEQN